MRPDHKYDRSRRVESSRARAHLTADLGWLSGFPVRQFPEGIIWRQCTEDQNPLGTEILVDREKIRRAEFTVSKFEHEYSKVLADEGTESAQWAERVRRLLDRFKAAIHSGEPLPARLPETMDAQPASVRKLHRELLSQHPTLEPLDNVISWRLYLEPKAVRSTLVWLTGHAHEVLGLLAYDSSFHPEEKWAWAMSLRRMADQYGAERTDKLIRYLGEPRLSETPFARDEYIEFLNLWSDRLSRFPLDEQPDPMPELPTTTLADQVHHVAIWIAEQPKATQAQALDLFNLLVDDTLFKAWHTFANRVKTAVSLGRRMTAVSTAWQFESRATNAHAAYIKNLAHHELPDIRLRRLTGTLESLCTPAMRLVLEELLRTLRSIPLDSGTERLRWDLCDVVLTHSSDLPGPRLATALGTFRQYLSSSDTSKLLAPLLSSRYRFAGIFNSGENGTRQARSFFGALSSLIEQDTRLTAKDLDNLESFAEVLPDVTDVVVCFLALKAVGLGKQSVDSDSIRCANRLSSHGVDFGACVVALEKMDTESSAPVIRVVDALHAVGQIGIAAHLVLHREYGLLIAAGRRLKVLHGQINLGQTPANAPMPQLASEWIHRYPLELLEALTRLATVTTDAERVAQRVLAKELPPPEAIASEIAALQDLLRTRPGDTHLEIRLANRLARQSSASIISPARVDKLRTRLELNASRLWIENWLGKMEEQVHAKIRTLFGNINIPDWVWHEANLRLVLAINKLEGRVRELGFQLIRRRCGPPPWDFHGEPANQEFLAKLRERGIDPGPLVDLPADISIQDAQGRRYQLGFERDPLEVLRMGEPFDTCLSPNGGNFFSAIVNAVDINKRVIYARDTDGKIVGRCLVAITDLGQLLTFRIYSNVFDLDLKTAVSQLVEALAQSMGTYVTKRGTVPTLVAPNWYNDGPQDLGSQFDFLVPGSPFREALATLPLPDLLPAIRAAFSPLPADDMMLTLMLELEEFDERPELILPLIPMLESAQHIPEILRWRAAARAHKAGRSDFAARVLNGRNLKRLVQMMGQQGICPCCTEPALRTQAELDPSAVLRVLRLTRSKSVRSDEAEYDGQRRYLLAEAHSRLGRNALAGRLRRSEADSTQPRG